MGGWDDWPQHSDHSHNYTASTIRTITITGGKIRDLYCGHSTTSTGDVFHNQLTNLDVSKNTALLTLNCSHNRLTQLDLSKNTALQILDCGYNKLSALDLGKNTTLWSIRIHSNLLEAEKDGEGLNPLFRSLHSNTVSIDYITFPKSIYINDNPGASKCDTSIAMEKGWEVQGI